MSLSNNRRYYLAFTHHTNEKVGLHCTHCYFGTYSNVKAREVGWKVDNYFKEHGPFVMPRIFFNKPAEFLNGRGEPKRVLLTDNIEAFEPFKELWDYFSDRKMMNTKFPFQPHVTTEHLDTVQYDFTAYALVKSGFIIRSWDIGVVDKDKAAVP